MNQYIEHILKKELELFVSLVVDKYGMKGNFTKSDLLNKFFTNSRYAFKELDVRC